MIQKRIHAATMLLIGESLGILAGLMVAFTGHALSWNLYGNAALFWLTWLYLTRRGKRDWGSSKRISAYPELLWLDSYQFLRRHVLDFLFVFGAFVVGYFLAAVALKVETTALTIAHSYETAEESARRQVHAELPSPGAAGFLEICAGLACAFYAFTTLALTGLETSFLRGRKLLSRDEAQIVALKRRPQGQETFPIGGVDFPDEASRTHICIVGTTGSGKTKTIIALLKYILRYICDGRDERALIFDPKQEIIPLLHALGVRCRILILNPFDVRCVAWDISRDCTSVTSAYQMAAIFISEDAGPNRFFTDAARHIVASVIKSFMLSSPGKWTLRDLILVLSNSELLWQCLKRHPETADACQYFDEERTFHNIKSCLHSKINELAPIAACWDRTTDKIALKDWIHDTSILVLGWVPSIGRAMDAVNRAIYQAFSERHLSQPQSQNRKVWQIFDEVKELSKLDSLPRVATFGRGVGSRLILGLQDLNGLRHVYGRELADEILGQCTTKALLRCDDTETASWAAKVIGDCEIIERRRSGIVSGKPNSGTVSESVRQTAAILTSEIMNLPATNPQNGLSGFYVSPFSGAFHSTLSGDEVDKFSPPVQSKVPGFIPRPSEHQMLRPFTETDYERLGLKPLP